MTTRAEIAAKLDDFSFQKVNFGGFLMNKRAKNSHALWTRTSDKGVTELTILTTRDFGEGNVYDVAAFTLEGTVPADVVAELRQQAESLTDRINLREHGYVYSCLEPWDGGGRHLDLEEAGVPRAEPDRSGHLRHPDPASQRAERTALARLGTRQTAS